MSPVRIQPLETEAERRACVALQEETWGPGFADRVPASILMVAGEMGGIASGAFDGDRLVGFVFGITGLRHGRLAHWSDMLAVRPGYRGQGLGVALKRHQRRLLLERGVELAYWTFDPLVARNAHLNLNRLGAVAREYHRDLYGDSDSPLHAGIGTDRLLAEWTLDSDRVRRLLDDDADDDADDVDAPTVDAPTVAPLSVVNPPLTGSAAGPAAGPAFPRPSSGVLEPAATRVGIAVPSDLMALKDADPDLARAWRANAREAFERCFRAGYVAGAVERGGGGTATYVLSRALAR